MRNPKLPPFEWQFKSDVTKKLSETSEYNNVYFSIDGKYQWGSGMTKDQESEYYENLCFYLVDAGFKLDRNYTLDGECPCVIPKKKYGDETYLYLHPAELTGYLKPSDVTVIEGVLDKMKDSGVIYDWELKKNKPVSCFTKSTYHKLMVENTSNLLDWMEKAEKNGYHPYTAMEEFSKNYRISKPGDKSCFSSLDEEFVFLKDLIEIKNAIEERAKAKEMETEEEDFGR